jgi:hypothetical protein
MTVVNAPSPLGAILDTSSMLRVFAAKMARMRCIADGRGDASGAASPME